MISEFLQSYLSTYLRLNFPSISAHTHTLNILLLEEALCLYFMPEELAALFLEVKRSSPSHSSALFAAPAPEHSSDVFSKLMRYWEEYESWNKWAYCIASYRATWGEGQKLEKIEENYLVSIYHLRRIEKCWLQKRKLKLDLFFSFSPAANVFPHKHMWFLACCALGSGVLEAFLRGEVWPGWQRGVLSLVCSSDTTQRAWGIRGFRLLHFVQSGWFVWRLCGGEGGKVHQTLPLRLLCAMLPWRPCQHVRIGLYHHVNIP